MLNRRTFLLMSAAATASILGGCGSNVENRLDITLLQGSIPLQLVGNFKKVIKDKKLGQLNFQPEIQLKTIFELLETWQKPDPEKSQSLIDSLPIVGNQNKKPANLVTLGDFWLEKAIAKNLIQPLDTSKLEAWNSLPEEWQNLVKRDRQGFLAPQGEVYGAPYRWGNTLIVYRKDKLNWTPTDWSDLWREELRGRISLLDSYREVIGLTLKKLGYSYNTDDLSQVPNLESELKQLHQQVKFYSCDQYLQPLVLGDTWLAVGWSADILPLTKGYPDLAIAVPASGTSLWADLWVQPQTKESTDGEAISSLAANWLDFCWQTKAAKQILLFTQALSPLLTAEKNADIVSDLAKNSVLQASLDNFAQSEFLLPFSAATTTEYRNLWQKIRGVSS